MTWMKNHQHGLLGIEAFCGVYGTQDVNHESRHQNPGLEGQSQTVFNLHRQTGFNKAQVSHLPARLQPSFTILVSGFVFNCTISMATQFKLLGLFQAN